MENIKGGNDGMSMEKKLTIALLSFVTVVALLIIYQRFFRPHQEGREISVTIEGNIKRPGTYFVPYGTSRFEVLRVAGVVPNSDINDLDVYAEAIEGEHLSVGTLDKEVALKGFGPSAKPCIVSFFVGDVIIAGKYGSRRPERDLPVFEGDKISCADPGTIELRLGDESLIDLKNHAEMTLSSLYKTDETGMMNVVLNLTKGKLWAYIKPQPQNVRFLLTTQYMEVEIKGTEVELVADSTSSTILLTKGMVNVGRIGSDRKITLTEGQKVTVFNDETKKMVPSNLSDEDRVSDPSMKTSQQEKEQNAPENEVRRILFLVLPDFYVLSEMNPSTSTISISRLQASMDVSEFVEGVDELGKVYLYGGIRLTTSVVERLTRKRVEHYGLMSRANVVDLINKIGGVYVDVDNISAQSLDVKPGKQRLDGTKAIKFIGLGLIGGPNGGGSAEEFIQRQNKILKAIFEASFANKIAFTAALFSQIIQSMDTDIDVGYLNDYYKTFKSKSDWKMNFASAN